MEISTVGNFEERGFIELDSIDKGQNEGKCEPERRLDLTGSVAEGSFADAFFAFDALVAVVERGFGALLAFFPLARRETAT